MLERREEAVAHWLVERATSKTPDWAFVDHWNGWEAWLLDHWPRWLTFSWWFYLLGDPGDRWHRPGTTAWINLWRPFWSWDELRYWLKSGRWRHAFLFEETRTYRIYCRIKGHPNGEIYYNPGGDEPDHRCKDCGEEIG